jgi:hypothetical protein
LGPDCVKTYTVWVKTGKSQREHMFSASPPKPDIAQRGRHVRDVPKTGSPANWLETWGVSEKQRSSGADHTARSSRVSISSFNNKKSIGLDNKPSAPPSIALRLVSASP